MPEGIKYCGIPSRLITVSYKVVDGEIFVNLKGILAAVPGTSFRKTNWCCNFSGKTKEDVNKILFGDSQEWSLPDYPISCLGSIVASVTNDEWKLFVLALVDKKYQSQTREDSCFQFPFGVYPENSSVEMRIDNSLFIKHRGNHLKIEIDWKRNLMTKVTYIPF
tara:strand:- start:274 stop:765 length:492 start_codon:yes stop_codon:yes gene_type:complete